MLIRSDKESFELYINRNVKHVTYTVTQNTPWFTTHIKTITKLSNPKFIHQPETVF